MACLNAVDTLSKSKRPYRIRNPPTLYTPSKTGSDVPVNFKLNKTKAIQKKLLATYRENDVHIVYKSGTLVLTFSAAVYELFKCAIFKYYETSDSKSCVVHTKRSVTNDADSLVIENSLSVSHKNLKGQLYRVNLFHTTCRTDVNGKHLNEFIHTDLVNVLELVYDRNNVQILNDRIRSACSEYLCAVGSESENSKKVDIFCLVCSKRCLTRSTQCSICQKWVHYKCEKLHPVVISELETERNARFTCKTCKSASVTKQNTPSLTTGPCDDNTVHCVKSKAVTCNADKSIEQESVSQKSHVQELTRNVVACKSKEQRSESCILIEHDSVDNVHESRYENEASKEHQTSCMICNTPIINIEREVCEICNEIVHTHCTQIVIVKDNDIKMCLLCAATSHQNAVNSNDTPVSNTDADQLTTAICQRSTNNGPTAMQNSPLTQPVRKGVLQGKKSQKSDTTNENNTKMKDLRTKEEKLRKWEEQLKLRETQLRSHEEDEERRKAYIAQIEARNAELQQTVRILKRRIVMLEDSSIDSSQTLKNQSTNSGLSQNDVEKSSETNKLIEGIHEKVTNFIVRKVDKELQALDVVNGASAIPTNVANRTFVNQQIPSAQVPLMRSTPHHQQATVFPDSYQQSPVLHNSRLISTPCHYPLAMNTQAVNSATGMLRLTTAPNIRHFNWQNFIGRPLFYGTPNQPTSSNQQQHFLGQRPILRLHR
ncbi:hypothetical protein FSP39_015236 [Pinctada imbricata]|uniref:Uncharacterized protein n=1 Tax=Pinctada imbricata TaxID=66713 RepID=A0AA88Y9I4_PINIB|nr:hypothetical protein FSP39_015236 [Pinctada imbricata]